MFKPQGQSLFTFFFSFQVRVQVFSKFFHILRNQDSFLKILAFILFFLVTDIIYLLQFEITEIFQLGPYKVGLFYAISKGKPIPSHDEASYHARVVAFAHVYFQSMFILYRWFYI